MKLKNYIEKVDREKATENLKQEISKDFGSLYRRPREKVLHYVKANPKKSFAFMMVFLLVNFAIVFYFDSKENNPAGVFTNFKDYLTNTPLIKTAGPIGLTYNNYEKITAIKDSLAYYANFKGPLSSADSVILTRLLKKYEEIDPTIFKSKNK
jgi:hypothetical protein